MIKKIDRPNWHRIIKEGERIFLDTTSKQGLNEWFNYYVQPVNEMLDKAVEVYLVDSYGFSEKTKIRTHLLDEHTHKGFLINIEPIKKDTAEDILRDLVKQGNMPIQTGKAWPSGVFDIYERAKALLEGGDE